MQRDCGKRRRGWESGGILTAVLFAGALGGSSILAQDGVPPTPPAAAPARSLWLDGGITVTAIGLGLFVVTRNSNRS